MNAHHTIAPLAQNTCTEHLHTQPCSHSLTLLHTYAHRTSSVSELTRTSASLRITASTRLSTTVRRALRPPLPLFLCIASLCASLPVCLFMLCVPLCLFSSVLPLCVPHSVPICLYVLVSPFASLPFFGSFWGKLFWPWLGGPCCGL
jgi:hypothetical protein